MIDVIFLGTSSQFPTKERNHSSIFFRLKKFKALLDCGEGTQRQMRILKLSPHHLNAVFITHWHGDHALGLGGIIQSLGASKREDALSIYGPKGTKERVEHLLKTYAFKPGFHIEVFEANEFDEELLLDFPDFQVYSFPLSHGVTGNGYYLVTKPLRRINVDYTKKFGLIKHPLLGDLQEGKDIVYKGKRISAKNATYLDTIRKLAYISDTKYFDNLIEYAKNSDLLICEATFSKKDEEKCKDYNHLSSAQAAMIAKKSNSKQLIMTHISQRYGNSKLLEEDAKKVFKNSLYAHDFMEYEIK
ncbi:MAG: ribonuclease Z [Candidatus Nanoarchaeia archaeon]|nr:ribonuclease Z [Candidatus Nanoarchaeia archaeon]